MIWKDVTDYEGIYEVSSCGKIRTKKGKTTHSDRHGKRLWKQRILKQKTDKNGYKRVTLWKNKKPKDFLVHRLVAREFLYQPKCKEIINHKDCDPGNNEVSNLEWCDYSHNIIHAFENGLNNSRHKTKLLNTNNGEVIEFKSKKEASLYLGKNKGYISAIVKRGSSTAGNYKILSK